MSVKKTIIKVHTLSKNEYMQSKHLPISAPLSKPTPETLDSSIRVKPKPFVDSDEIKRDPNYRSSSQPRIERNISQEFLSPDGSKRALTNMPIRLSPNPADEKSYFSPVSNSYASNRTPLDDHRLNPQMESPTPQSANRSLIENPRLSNKPFNPTIPSVERIASEPERGIPRAEYRSVGLPDERGDDKLLNK